MSNMNELCVTGVSLTSETDCPTKNSTSVETEGQWNTIIVKHIPFHVKEFISLFSPYGSVENICLCKPRTNKEQQPEQGENQEKIRKNRIVRVIFANEAEAIKVWEASQEKLIKYHDFVLKNYVLDIQKIPAKCFSERFDPLDTIQDKFDMEMVCKQWKENGHYCWSNITKIIKSADWDIDIWRVILSRVGNSLENVELDFTKVPNAYDFLNAVTESCINLKRLKCAFRNIDYLPCAPGMNKIIQQCKSLRQIKFAASAGSNVDVNFMKGLPDDLVEIDVRVFTFKEIDLPVALSKFKNLRSLTLQGIVITDQSINDVVSLDRLFLSHCVISDSIFSKIIRNNKDLKYLNITSCSLTSESSISIQRLEKLQFLQIGWFDDAHIDELPRLRALECALCTTITDVKIESFFNTAEDIEELGIFWCPITLKSIMIAQKWTERTGKSLKLFVDSKLFSFYEKSKFPKTEKFQVIESTYMRC